MVRSSNVIVQWQGGSGPFQLVCRTNLAGDWRNDLTSDWRKIGQPTAGFSATNPLLPGPACFFLVTTDMTPPATPSGLRITTNSCSQLLVSWNASADNAGGAGLKGYNVFRNGVFMKQVPASTNSMVENGLASQTAYSYTVSAVDLVGNQSAQSAALSAITPACPNQPPIANAGPDQVATAGIAVTFSGTSSRDPDGTINSYSWSFGDGATGSGIYASHTYGNSGTFTTTLTVTDNLGATASDSAVVTVAAPAPAGQFISVAGLGGASSDAGQSVAVDRSGNVFVGGTVSSRPYLAKRSPSGSLLWGFTIGGPGSGSVQGMATDTNGDVLVTGNFGGTLDFGGGGLPSAGGYDIFVAKFSGSGSYIWSKKFGSSKVNTFVTESGFGIAVDTNNNSAAVVGIFDGTVDFGGGPLTSSSGQDLFLARFSSAGTNLWSKRVGGAGLTTGSGVAVDANGNIFVTGSFGLTVDFGGGSVTSVGPSDMFIAKYSAGGTNVWVNTCGNRVTYSSTTVGTAVALDRFGNAVVTGSFQNTMSFGGPPLTSAGYEDIFLAKYSSTNGGHLWSKRFGSVGTDLGYGVAVDNSGNITLTGRVISSVDFGGGPVPAATGQNACVANFAADGSHRWSKIVGAGHEEGRSVAANANGHSFVLGRFANTVDFGNGPMTSAGGWDLFLVEFGP